MGERPRDPGIIYLSKKVAEFSTLRYQLEQMKETVSLWFLTNYITFLQKNKFFSSYWKKIHCLFINNIKKI